MTAPENPNHNQPEPRTSDRVWRTVGIVLAVILVIAGLAAIALFILFAIAMNSWGSNK